MFLREEEKKKSNQFSSLHKMETVQRGKGANVQ